MAALSRRLHAARDLLWLFPLAAVGLLAAYAPALHGTMLWDDDGHLTGVALRSWAGLARIWFEPGATQQYYPLVHSMFWLQARLWGDAFLGYHVVNVLLHALSACLLVAVLRDLDVPGALVAGAVFALHPVQVESVAWMTELKNTLSGVFFFATALTYLRFDRERTNGSYVLALGLFFCALASKTVTATLPVVLLIVFWWRRGTLDWRRDVRPLLLFLALGAAAGVTTAWVERTFIGARGADFALSAVERVLVAGRAIVFYAITDLWPARLTFIYPRWTVSEGVWWQYLFPLAVVLAVGACWAMRAWSRAPLASVLIFIATLAPALGFVDVYPFRYSFVADHFQYLACVAVFVPIAATLTRLAARTPLHPGLAQALLCAVLVMPLAVITHAQAAEYIDARTLYTATLRDNPGCWLCLENLGVLQIHERPPNREEAIALFRQGLRINARDPQLHSNLGTTLMELGHLDEAVAEQREAIRYAPNYAEAYANLGVALHKLGRLEEAAAAYRTALDIKPDLTFARSNLAAIPEPGGHPPDSGAAAGQSLDTLGTHTKSGIALARDGRLQEAAAEFRLVVRQTPNDPAAHANLANVMMSLQDFAGAIVEFRESVRLDPSVPTAHNDLGVALARVGRRDEAVLQFHEALRLKPDYQAARTNLARATKQP